MLSEKPKADIRANVPTRLIGMAITGTRAARQLCRNMKMTSTTSAVEMNRVE